MKSTTLSFSVLSAVTLVVALVACANSTAPIPEDGDGTAAATGTSTSATEPTGSATSSAPTSTKTCVAKCTQDSDCSNSCPSVSAAVQCCDTNTNACFSSPGTSCPAPAANNTDDDAGSGSSTPSY